MNSDLLIQILGFVFAIVFSVLYFSVKRKKELVEKEKTEIQNENTSLSTELRLTQETLEKERQWSSQIEEKLKDSFSSLATDALEKNQSRFLELANADFDKKQMSMDALMKPMQDTLKRYEGQVTELERERQRSYATLELEVKKMAETSLNLSKETSALKNALKKPHVRGRWGEVQLKNCVELAGMSDHIDVSFQNSVESDGQRLIPDMVVRMPGDRVVIVDSKTPVEAFLASLEASTEEEKNAEMMRHGRHIKTHIQQLSEKGYAQKIKNSADFTVMFLPNESFLYAALETQSDLVDYALSKKILIATPPTLVGLLKVIRFGWSEKKLAKNAAEIAEIGKELHKRIVDFIEAYDEVGDKLDRAQKAYEKGRMRLQSRIASKARQLEELGAKGAKDLPELPRV